MFLMHVCFHEHRHAFQAHVPEFGLPFRRAGLDLAELIGGSKWILGSLCPD